MRKAEIRRSRLMRQGQVPGVLVISGKATELDDFENSTRADDSLKEILGATHLQANSKCPLPDPIIYASQNGKWHPASLTAQAQAINPADLHETYHVVYRQNQIHTRRYKLAEGLDAEQVELEMRRILKAKKKFASLDIYLEGIFRANQQMGWDSPSLREPPVALKSATAADFENQVGFGRVELDPNRPKGKGVTVVILDTSPDVNTICSKAVDFWLDLSLKRDFPHPLPHEKDAAALEDPKLNSVADFKAHSRNRQQADALPNDTMQPFHGLFIATLLRHIVPEATIVLVKTLDEHGEAAGTTLTHALEVIQYLQEAKVTANGRRVVEDKLVFNLSFGLSRTQSEEVDAPYMLNTCDLICKKDSLIIAATGNNSFRRHPENPQEPSAYGYFSDTPQTNTNVIAVAATSDRPTDYAWFSNRSNLAAPGLDLVLDVGELTQGAPCRYVKWSGTSFAAPIVAAFAASLLSAPNPPKINEVKKILWKTASPPDEWIGVPEVSLSRALAAL